MARKKQIFGMHERVRLDPPRVMSGQAYDSALMVQLHVHDDMTPRDYSRQGAPEKYNAQYRLCDERTRLLSYTVGGSTAQGSGRRTRAPIEIRMPSLPSVKLSFNQWLALQGALEMNTAPPVTWPNGLIYVLEHLKPGLLQHIIDVEASHEIVDGDYMAFVLMCYDVYVRPIAVPKYVVDNIWTDGPPRLVAGLDGTEEAYTINATPLEPKPEVRRPAPWDTKLADGERQIRRKKNPTIHLDLLKVAKQAVPPGACMVNDVLWLRLIEMMPDIEGYYGRRSFISVLLKDPEFYCKQSAPFPGFVPERTVYRWPGEAVCTLEDFPKHVGRNREVYRLMRPTETKEFLTKDKTAYFGGVRFTSYSEVVAVISEIVSYVDKYMPNEAYTRREDVYQIVFDNPKFACYDRPFVHRALSMSKRYWKCIIKRKFEDIEYREDIVKIWPLRPDGTPYPRHDLHVIVRNDKELPVKNRPTSGQVVDKYDFADIKSIYADKKKADVPEGTSA